MLQNKIYKNFFTDIIKKFLVILLGLTILAFTVRAVNFLDLIVHSGYPLIVYFQYSILNLFGIIPKLIPLSFLLALTIFILKHIQDKEFIILWISGVHKLSMVNFIFLISIFILIFHLIFSVFLTPFALNKSRLILSQDQLNSFLPTIKPQQFSDSFKGFTFFVEEKNENRLKNIFIHDKGDNLKNFSSNNKKKNNTTIISQGGIVEENKIFLFNGKIINSEYGNNESDIIKFDEFIIDLSDLSTTTIKNPKLQETSTFKLLKCITSNDLQKKLFCKNKYEEIIPTLNRRITLPFYIPVLSIICSLLFFLKKNKFYFNKIVIFIYSFLILLFTELAVRYTGLSSLMRVFFIIFPFILIVILYFFLVFNFSNKSKTI
ncbi:LptF/LptG family permease [Pelagibacteraceae bacterium]|nr:LptF/LptG family permease [Pelagibacteraceae bacterium]